MDRVYLIPGFFGFANLGDVRYFGHAIDTLVELGWSPDALHVVPTGPTASLTARAARLATTIAQTAGPTDRLHLVGHSSGGLDARLLVTPGVRLPTDVDTAALAERVRTVITVATPHRGTPSADFFVTVSGKRLLRLLSMLTIVTVRRGGAAFRALLRVSSIVHDLQGRFRHNAVLGNSPSLTDALYHQLLHELSPERRDEVTSFFADVSDDQALLAQLMPSSAAVFDATTADRDDVRYGCVLTRAQRPRLRRAVRAGSPAALVALGVYALCWRLASRSRGTPAEVAELQRFYPTLTAADNDGMVPTWSQSHGAVIGAFAADHLDILGHFPDEHRLPPHYDWLTTGTGYRYPSFFDTWSRIHRFIRDA